MPSAIPEGLHTVTPALAVTGAAEAIAFYKRAFGAEERSRALDPTGTQVWHAELRIGNSALFVNDAAPQMGAPATTSSLWIYTEDVDGLFARAVAAGATPFMPPADMFWGDRVAGVSDRWGTRWNIAKRVKDLTPDEMKAAQDAFVASMKR